MSDVGNLTNATTTSSGTSAAAESLAAARQRRLALRSHPNLKDKAAAYIRDEILTGRMRPGEKVDQELIADTLGMSRLPVREALIELTQECLVDSIPRRGSFVAHITEEDILDQYRIQGMIAGIGAERAARRLSDEELATMRALLEAALETDDAQEEADLTFSFHQVMLEAGASNRLFSILRLLYRSLPTDYFLLPAPRRDTNRKHLAALLGALERRDGKEAAAIQEQLWTELGSMTVALLEGVGLWDTGSDTSTGSDSTDAA